MLKNQIRVGGKYHAKVSRGVVIVRVDAIREVQHGARPETRYDVTNLSSGRKTTFRSAAKFRDEAADEQVIAQTVKIVVPTQPKTKETNVPTPNKKKPVSPVCRSCNGPIMVGDAFTNGTDFSYHTACISPPKTQTQVNTARAAVVKDRLGEGVAALAPKPEKKFGPVFDAGGGIGVQVEVIDAPKPPPAARAVATPKAKTPAKVVETIPAVKAEPKPLTPAQRTLAEYGKGVMDVLTQWANEASDEGSRCNVALKYFARRRTLSSVPVGAVVQQPHSYARPVEVVEQNPGIVTVKTEAGKREDWAPGTEVELSDEKMLTPEDRAQIKAEVAAGSVAEPKVSKPRSGGLFGFPATAIARWMGGDGWTKEEAIKCFAANGIPVSDATIGIQVNAGKKGGDCGGRGPAPVLTDDQANGLRVTVGKGVATPAPKTPVKKR